jgi:O-antigen/teichoic acid export membrane protein
MMSGMFPSQLRPSALLRLLRHDFVQGSGIITVTSFGVSVLNYLFNLLVARHVSLGDYGEYSTAMATILLATIPVGALGMYLVRRFGSQPVQERWRLARRLEQRLTGTVVHYSGVLALLCLILGWLLFAHSHLMIVTTVFVISSSILTLWQTFYLATLQASQKFWWFGGIQIGFSVARLTGGLIALQFHPQLPLLLLSMSVATLAQLGAGYWLIRQEGKKDNTVKMSAPVAWQQLFTFCQRKEVLLPLLTTLGLVGLSSLDIIFVKIFFPADQAGLYSALSLLAKVVLYVTQPLAIAGYTFFTNHEHREQARFYLLVLTIVTVVVSAIGVLGYSLLSVFTITLFFDSRFLAIQPWLGWAAVYGGLYSLVYLFVQYFLAMNRWYTLGLVAILGLQVLTMTVWHPHYTSVLFLNIFLCAILVTFFAALVIWEDVISRVRQRFSLAKS